MEYLSSGDANIGLENNLPVVAIPQLNAYFAPVGQMYNPMVQPMQMQPQTNALVQYQPPLETTNSAVGSMVVARQPANPTIPPQVHTHAMHFLNMCKGFKILNQQMRFQIQITRMMT